MKLSSQPPGTYACWVSPQSKGFFVNSVTKDGIYCHYDSFLDAPIHYKLSETDVKYANYALIMPIDKLPNYSDLKLTHPEMFI